MKTVFAAFAAILGWWLLVNLIGAALVGALARWALPGKDKMGWFKTILLGFLGGVLGKLVAFIAGWRFLGILGGFVVSVLGAVVLLVAHRIWTASKSRSPA